MAHPIVAKNTSTCVWALSTVLGVTIAVAFFGLGYEYLRVAHPHEDAYILFRYVNNIVAGLGIVFNPQGQRAEGATDFLWLLILWAGGAVGLDPALSALFANSVGAAIAATLVAWALMRSRLTWSTTISSCLAAPMVLLFNGALAAYGGFSAMLYSAVCLLPVAIGMTDKGSVVWAVPAGSLVIALMRPDGAILAPLFVLLGFFLARRHGAVGAYLKWTASAMVAGTAYFAWRYWYFGLLLPLPLYVKSHGQVPDFGPAGINSVGKWIVIHFPGFWHNVAWVKELHIHFVAAGIIAAAAVSPRRHLDKLRTSAWLLPAGALIIALSFAHMSQNISFRFQAPVLLALWFVLALFVGESQESASRVRRLIGLGSLVLGTVPWAIWGGREVLSLFRGGVQSYVDDFAPRVGAEMQGRDLIVITEAGRIPYWSPSTFIDAVGLNSPDTALSPLSLEALDRMRPDVVMYHQSETLDLDNVLGPSAGAVVALSSEQLTRAVLPGFRGLFDDPPTTYLGTRFATTDIAAMILSRWLSLRRDYAIFAVRYGTGNGFEHVYGMRLDWPARERALEILRETTAIWKHEAYWSLARRHHVRNGIGLVTRDVVGNAPTTRALGQKLIGPGRN